jgi:hypothetical protein
MFAIRKRPCSLLFSDITMASAGTLFSPRLGGREKSSDDWFEPALFRDSRDGEFDMSDWLASRYGFLAVPILITGPTPGAGGGSVP